MKLHVTSLNRKKEEKNERIIFPLLFFCRKNVKLNFTTCHLIERKKERKTCFQMKIELHTQARNHVYIVVMSQVIDTGGKAVRINQSHSQVYYMWCMINQSQTRLKAHLLCHNKPNMTWRTSEHESPFRILISDFSE